MNRKTVRLLIGLAFGLAVPILVARLAATPAPDAQALPGLWASAWGAHEGDRVRFYYFHPEGGIGLYRYGRVGLNQTNSFTWSVDADTLTLVFKKTGEKRTTHFTITTDGDGTRALVLDDDPRDAPRTAYRYVPPPPLGDDAEAAFALDGATAEHPLARMWTHATSYQTGGMGFEIYQLKPPALDGRGVGWFHRGDFDDWTTETLVYRVGPESIDLVFPIRKERASSPVAFGDADGKRVMDVRDDPRNFWHRRIYVDGGRSFTADTVAEAHLTGGEPLPLPLDALIPELR